MRTCRETCSAEDRDEAVESSGESTAVAGDDEVEHKAVEDGDAEIGKGLLSKGVRHGGQGEFAPILRRLREDRCILFGVLGGDDLRFIEQPEIWQVVAASGPFPEQL